MPMGRRPEAGRSEEGRGIRRMCRHEAAQGPGPQARALVIFCRRQGTHMIPYTLRAASWTPPARCSAATAATAAQPVPRVCGQPQRGGWCPPRGPVPPRRCTAPRRARGPVPVCAVCRASLYIGRTVGARCAVCVPEVPRRDAETREARGCVHLTIFLFHMLPLGSSIELAHRHAQSTVRKIARGAASAGVRVWTRWSTCCGLCGVPVAVHQSDQATGESTRAAPATRLSVSLSTLLCTVLCSQGHHGPVSPHSQVSPLVWLWHDHAARARSWR